MRSLVFAATFVLALTAYPSVQQAPTGYDTPSMQPGGRARRRAFEVVVVGRVAEARESGEDLFVILREEGKRFGVELDGHGMSSYFVKIAAVAAAIPSLETLASGTRAKAS